MLTVGDQFPSFSLIGVLSERLGESFVRFTQDSVKGRWVVFFFWPKDFTFVCPTEIIEFGKLYESFQNRNTEVYGCSTDSDFAHLSWRRADERIRNIPFAMLSDSKRDLSLNLGILTKEDGVCLRATFIMDPQLTIRHVSVNDLLIGRSPKESLRILDALQTGNLCGCNWEKGDEPLKAV